MTPPSGGRLPPLSPVPAPRATKGIPASWSIRTTAATSSVVVGYTTAWGAFRSMVSPSHS